MRKSGDMEKFVFLIKVKGINLKVKKIKKIVLGDISAVKSLFNYLEEIF